MLQLLLEFSLRFWINILLTSLGYIPGFIHGV
ncbi:MAG: YqaE/Pmp3 family membrane protein [Desulforhopalus sp.]|nr:YqaE/Pmp3 family membrane protein [Desulforhopalus sp.]